MRTVRAGPHQARLGGSSRPRRRPLIYGLGNQQKGAKARRENWLFNLFTFDIQPPPQALILASSPSHPPPPPTKGALCAPRALPAAARCARAPAARGPPITALRRDAGRPRPLLQGSSPSGRGALCPPTPQKAERGCKGPGLRSPNKEPLWLPFLRPSVIPLFLRLVLDAPRAGGRRVGTLLASQRSSCFLRSEKALGRAGRGSPTLILAATGLRAPRWRCPRPAGLPNLPWAHTLTARPRPGPGPRAVGPTRTRLSCGPRHLGRLHCPSREM